ncbi:MAG: 50S ribosomal protein L1, partial [Mailhella sp.]|nr:50S ribosomal protein L1 [Mailhella sp.]
MPTHGKNYRKSLEGVDLTQRFSVEDAVAKSLGASFAKFDETVDVALRLGVDPKYSDQMVRGAVSLPHGLGKTVRVAVFCKGEKQAEATAAGADVVGAEDLVAQIKGGWLEFDA